MRRTVVFVPAWNEEQSLPTVLRELRDELPGADIVVINDGSTDATADAARAAGADVVSFEENRGLRAAIAAGYDVAVARGYELCGRVDADGQHPVRELRRLLERVADGDCDVAVGSRFVSGDGYGEHRYRPSADRALGIAVLRRLMQLRLDRPFGDATSGMYAVNRRAAELLAQPYVSDAPEVEGLIRLEEAGLRVLEVPVDMRDRSGGDSKLSGKRAVKVVLTIGGTLLLGRRVLRLLRR